MLNKKIQVTKMKKHPDPKVNDHNREQNIASKLGYLQNEVRSIGKDSNSPGRKGQINGAKNHSTKK